jgi:hypothetical protein
MMRAAGKALKNKSVFLSALGRGKGTLLTVVVALTLATVTPALAANGGNFILGKINTATAFSRLTANVAGPAMQIFNTNTAGNARALDLVVDAGNPPMTVNATAGKALNLDADKLDSKDSKDFMPAATYQVSVTTTGGDVGGGVKADGAFCDSGDTLLSGGLSNLDAGTTIESLEPQTANREFVARWRPSGNDSVVVTAVCADSPPAHQ